MVTNLINRHAGITPIPVDKEVSSLIQSSICISAITQGAFDITYGSIDKKLWNFDQTMTALPDAATARQGVRLINYQNIILDERNGTVFLKEKGMRMIAGKKYSHTIDPKTGLPVTGIKSVTIICPNAEIADAMATPVMIMGVKVGLNMINQLQNMGCVIIDDSNKIFTSNKINLQ